MSRRLKLDVAPPPVLVEGDARVQALQNARDEPTDAVAFVAEICRLWGRAQGAFLEIGRLLIRAKETLAHGDYTTAVEAELPFSARTAYQLREAARWAMAGSIPLERLPGAYSTIYLLSTLDEPTLKEAQNEGLIRPELKRAELIAWRQGRAGEKDPIVVVRERILRLRREKLRLEEQLREAEQTLDDLEDK